MTFFAQLQEQTAGDRDYLLSAPIIGQAMAGAVSRESYLAFLTQAYHHVKHTVPLLMACGARLPDRLEWLRGAVAGYIEEEIGHQDWILDDIAAAGGNASAVRAGAPAFETEVMVAYAYDTIARGNPVGFFGMVYVLEGTSVELATQLAGKLSTSLDLPSSAFTYLSSHGCLDQQHILHFQSLVNRLEEPADRAALIHGARVFFRLYGDVIRSLPMGRPQ